MKSSIFIIFLFLPLTFPFQNSSNSAYTQDFELFLRFLTSLKISESSLGVNCAKNFQLIQNQANEYFSKNKEWDSLEKFKEIHYLEKTLTEIGVPCFDVALFEGNQTLIQLSKSIDSADFASPTIISDFYSFFVDTENTFEDSLVAASPKAKNSPKYQNKSFLAHLLHDVHWDFSFCSCDTAIKTETVSLDHNPQKGSHEGFNLQGTSQDNVELIEVHIIVFINGNSMKHINDSFARGLSKGQHFAYRFDFDIPPFFPAVGKNFLCLLLK